jgi:hypothetical protein
MELHQDSEEVRSDITICHPQNLLCHLEEQLLLGETSGIFLVCVG